MSDATQTPARRSPIAVLFTDHPATVNETFLQHMRFAFGFSFWLGVASLAALVHAFIPALCETTASRILTRLHARIQARH
jgi:hypothetical protein|uniref:DUF6356 family protein n=1 Tax=Yoonia sp. TaxID=2212373 RepID=UPI004047F7B1|tara:strand:+ start:134338 stop:134577 length:240 start_codon:yes stop_codon:yes gene_type:complete